jgi:hypothetical protein
MGRCTILTNDFVTVYFQPNTYTRWVLHCYCQLSPCTQSLVKTLHAQLKSNWSQLVANEQARIFDDRSFYHFFRSIQLYSSCIAYKSLIQSILIHQISKYLMLEYLHKSLHSCVENSIVAHVDQHENLGGRILM